MQASSAGGNKPEKRYSPCFREENGRKSSLGGKRKRDDVFKCVSAARARHDTLDNCHVSFYHISDERRLDRHYPNSYLNITH